MNATTMTSPPEAAAPPRRRLLRGDAADPAWARPALGVIVAAAFALYAVNLSANGNANTYYAAAVLSATQSWKAFFFGSLDAGSFITVDKPPMALWLMALPARALGFSSWSMLLPQALAGAASVAVLYTTVRRALGAEAALIAAAVLALTPITVAINRDNNPDTLLVLWLVTAAWATQRAVTSPRRGLGWVVLAAVLVGCGFNTKMLQAYLVVPALALAYLVAARPARRRRIVHLLAAGAALAVSSLWWMAIVDLIPAGSRPYVGGSTDNTVWDLITGYNGLGRILGDEGPGPGGGGAGFGGAPGAGRMFNDIIGGQISWLLPWAALCLVAGLILLRRRPRTDPARASLLLWGGWLAVHLVVFSFAEGVFHPYYTTAMAPAVAALTGGGAVLLWRAHRTSWVWALVAAAGVAVTGWWAFTLLARTPEWTPWLRWAIMAATVAAVAALLAGRLLRLRRVIVVVSVAGTVTAGLSGPAAFAVSAARGQVNGTNPLAGPASQTGPGGGFRPGRLPGGAPGGFPGGLPDGRPGGAPGNLPFPRGGPPTGFRGGGPGQVNQQMTAYLERNQGQATWLVAVGSAQQASSLILQTGEPVIAMGGFTGSDPAMTAEKLAELVAQGKLRYLLLGGRGTDSQVTAWVQQHGTLIDPSAYGGQTGSDDAGQLYRLNV